MSVDGGPFQSLGTNSTAALVLSDGAHLVAVKAIDAVGHSATKPPQSRSIRSLQHHGPVLWSAEHRPACDSLRDCSHAALEASEPESLAPGGCASQAPREAAIGAAPSRQRWHRRDRSREGARLTRRTPTRRRDPRWPGSPRPCRPSGVIWYRNVAGKVLDLRNVFGRNRTGRGGPGARDCRVPP